MIEIGRLPSVYAMTDGATLGFGFNKELARVDIFVTTFAFERSVAKHNSPQPSRDDQRPVALGARHALVRAGEREARLGMVEAREFAPGLDVVAPLASLPELPLMGIPVTAGAGGIREPEGDGVGAVRHLLMAIAAGHGDVRSRQREFRLAVPREGELRRTELVDCVALLAAVVVGAIRELAVMRVTVAIRAPIEGDFINGRGSRRLVARRAGHSGMAAQQRVSALHVRRHGEGGRFPSIHRVATSALAACPRQELAAMHVVVAGLTLLMGDRRLEIGRAVTPLASQAPVLAEQGEFGLRMVEGGNEVAGRFPGHVVMAGTARRRKGGPVRVAMAGTALRKSNPDELRAGPACQGRLNGGMALRAQDLLVGAGQAEFRCRVVETGYVFPSRSDVAAFAACAELALVHVLVAARALAAQPEVRPAEVLHQDAVPGGRRDVFGVVAALASQAGVAAIERVAGLAVVKLLQAYIPPDGDKVLAVVLGVAANTFFFAPVLAKE